MVQHHLQCFVVADGGQARFVKPASDNALHSWAMMESSSIHQKSHDLVSDGPGRSFESASPTRHAVAPRSDPHDRAETNFAHLVAARVCAEAAAGTFNEFILVAPAHVLADIQEKLDPKTKALVTGTLAKDLVNVPTDELWTHLKPWARAVHRA